jgi:site-specific DNA recombinase
MAATAIYARISDDRADGAGVGRQLEDCRALVAARGWEPAVEYVDNGASASSYAAKVRPEYRRMLAAVRAGEVSRIVVWASDRLYRRLVDLEELVTLAESGGAGVVAVTGGEVDLGTADGRMVARLLAAVGARESDGISGRIKRQQQQRREQGQPHGGVTRPFGYRRANGDGLVPDPEEAALLRTAMEDVIRGKSLEDIALEWTAAGVRTAQGRSAVWQPTSVAVLLRNPRNIGMLTHRGQIIRPGNWPPIVDRALWERCQATIAGRNRSGGAPPRRGVLTHLLVCGRCGAMLNAGRNAKGRYYRCRTAADRTGATGCGQLSIAAEPVEAFVLGAVLERASGAQIESLIEASSNDAEVRAITDELGGLDAQLTDLADSFAAATGASAKVLLIATEGIERRQRQLRGRLDRLTTVTTAAALAYAGKADALRADWEDGTLTTDQKHAIIAALVGKVTVLPVGRGNWTAGVGARLVIGDAAVAAMDARYAR